LIYSTNQYRGVAVHARLPPADVRLSTVLVVEHVLRTRGEPVSRNEILRRLAARSRSTTRQKLNAVLRYLEAHGLVAEGSKGVQWVASHNPRLLAAIAASVRVR